MKSHGHISLQAKQICSDCFMFPLHERVLIVPDLSPSLVYWLISVSQKLGDNSCCSVAYRGLLLYHWIAHEHEYTRYTDYWLAELHCSMVLYGSLAFSIRNMSNLIRTYVFVTNQTLSTLFWLTDRHGFLSSLINI